MPGTVCIFDDDLSPVLVDWVRVDAYPAQGSYTSCISDARDTARLSRVGVSASVPAGTSVVIESRTSKGGITWSSWNATELSTSDKTVLTKNNPGGATSSIVRY